MVSFTASHGRGFERAESEPRPPGSGPGGRGLTDGFRTVTVTPCDATVWRAGKWYVSLCPELDVASQGETEEEALANLKEAMELHFEPPQATRPPQVRVIEAEVGAA
jgi:predicted RNase H-like HicB family nuclease